MELVRPYLPREQINQDNVLVSANRACALRALDAGVRLYAECSITASSEIMESMARELPHVGHSLALHATFEETSRSVDEHLVYLLLGDSALFEGGHDDVRNVEKPVDYRELIEVGFLREPV